MSKKIIYNTYSQRFHWFNLQKYYPKIIDKFMDNIRNKKLSINIMYLMFPTTCMLRYDLLFKQFIKNFNIEIEVKKGKINNNIFICKIFHNNVVVKKEKILYSKDTHNKSYILALNFINKELL